MALTASLVPYPWYDLSFHCINSMIKYSPPKCTRSSYHAAYGHLLANTPPPDIYSIGHLANGTTLSGAVGPHLYNDGPPKFTHSAARCNHGYGIQNCRTSVGEGDQPPPRGSLAPGRPWSDRSIAPLLPWTQRCGQCRTSCVRARGPSPGSAASTSRRWVNVLDCLRLKAYQHTAIK